ncbi:hypothetical protein NM208_g1683 [Fusarium decemcellulare]|uniref:Uncharacterized protein n=1 Tax=Fusarium decemcellulare TaxID=57161 RepID=A0ACC1SVF4_9HYPO|nr:hypothetical protein NM208_g1683 [Fusarium decemcellulare]
MDALRRDGAARQPLLFPPAHSSTSAGVKREFPAKVRVQKQVHHCGLERLPPEVRRQLLSDSDLPQLKALVRASPIFHQQYLCDRKYILCRSLEKTLGKVAVDAYLVNISATKDNDPNHDQFWLLKLFSEQTAQGSMPTINKATLDEALDMTRFYLDFVHPIAEHYARWSLDHLATRVSRDSSRCQQEHKLSSVESIRFRRAIYRFQLLCQLFEWAAWPFGEDTARNFLYRLHPWEKEEISSFYQFAYNVYDESHRAKVDLAWDDTDDGDPSRWLSSEWMLDNFGFDQRRAIHLENTTLCGLSLLHGVLFKTRNKNQPKSLIPNHMYSEIDLLFVAGDLSTWVEMQEQRNPLVFRGDRESDAPPLAWTMSWLDKDGNPLRFHVPDALRRWGYVFWDAATLDNTGAKETVYAHDKHYRQQAEDYHLRTGYLDHSQLRTSPLKAAL